MSEENKIKQFEEEQLDKLLVELKDIDNFKGFEDGAFKYSLGKYQADLLLEHIDNLQQEHNILTEFEKWLDLKMEQTKKYDTKNYHNDIKLIISTYKFVLEKLQELSEEYKNFTMLNNEEQGDVKFIIIMDSIKKADENKQEAYIEEDKTKNN